MEYEFDKEIDAILRKAGGSVGEVSAISGPHIDADTIAAFTENALPAAARVRFVEHTADCIECRRALSNAITLLPEQPVEKNAAAAAAEPAPAPKKRWRIFGVPAFAAALSGILLMVFAGLIGFRLISGGGSSALVAQKEVGDRPEAFDRRVEGESPLASNTAGSSSVANAVPQNSNLAVPAVRNSLREPDTVSANANASAKTDDIDLRARSKQLAQPSADNEAAPMVSAPPAPKLAAEPARDEAADSALKEKKTLSKSEAIGPPAKARADSQAYSKDSATAGAAPVNERRSVGGKTFTRRNNIWYDNSYNGGKTKNVYRDCAGCQPLEPALRSIADTLPGVIVVVWKGENLMVH